MQAAPKSHSEEFTVDLYLECAGVWLEEIEIDIISLI